jgi:hypothetical protein
MNSSTRSHSSARALVAAVLFAAFSWTLLVSVSPQLHARIHPDASGADHTCAVTLLLSGSYDHAKAPPLVDAPRLQIGFGQTPAPSSTWVQLLTLRAHIFAHAPPALD